MSMCLAQLSCAARMNAGNERGRHKVLHALWYNSCGGSLRGEKDIISLFVVTGASPSVSSGSRVPKPYGVTM